MTVSQQAARESSLYHVAVHFFDHEVIEGSAERFSLDYPELLLQPSAGGNNRLARVPFPAVKMIRIDQPSLLEVAPQLKEAGYSQAVIHFSDGDVIRGYIEGSPHVGRYGLLLRLQALGATKADVRLVGIPYSSLKAIFYVDRWDTEAEVNGGVAG